MQNVFLKKLTCKGDFVAGVYLSEAKNPMPTPRQ